MSEVNKALPKVLARIDADLDNSLDRLFKFLAIKSISTDPAYADECRVAATSVAADLATLGFAAEVHPTDGHPVVLGKANFAPGAEGRPVPAQARRVLRAL